MIGEGTLTGDDLIGGVGYAGDGTFGVPLAAQQFNDPSNTAGYGSFTAQSAIDLLKFGIGAASDAYKFDRSIDYQRYDATRGGLFRQGAAAPFAPVGNANQVVVSPLWLIAGALVVYLLVKQG